MERYDIAIIGTGPAGLSAALTARARNKNFILFGNSGLSDKVRKAHSIENYLGLPHVSGEKMQEIFLAQIADAGIEITEKKVTLVYPMGDYFSIQADSDIYEASSVILASGMVPAKTLEGEDTFLGRGVSYCATCDAALYKGKTAVIIGYNPDEESEALFMTEFADKVTYIPMYKSEPAFVAKPGVSANDMAEKSNMNSEQDNEQSHEQKPEQNPEQRPANIEVVRKKPLKFTGGMKADTLVTDDGEIKADGFFVLRESVAPARLVPGLTTDGNHVVTGRSAETSVPGCFAAGDITGTPYQYMKAAGEGNVAALSAVKYVDNLTHA